MSLSRSLRPVGCQLSGVGCQGSGAGCQVRETVPEFDERGNWRQIGKGKAGEPCHPVDFSRPFQRGAANSIRARLLSLYSLVFHYAIFPPSIITDFVVAGVRC
jgi:hypothetical protein